MEALPERDENVIYFLTDRRGLREYDIEIYPEVYLTFVYPAENVYLGLRGRRSSSTMSTVRRASGKASVAL